MEEMGLLEGEVVEMVIATATWGSSPAAGGAGWRWSRLFDCWRRWRDRVREGELESEGERQGEGKEN